MFGAALAESLVGYGVGVGGHRRSRKDADHGKFEGETLLEERSR